MVIVAAVAVAVVKGSRVGFMLPRLEMEMRLVGEERNCD